MTLQDALNGLDKLDDDDVIFARRPWTAESEAEIGRFDASSRIPAEQTSRSLEYFLEVFVAREDVLDGIEAYSLTPAERNALIIYYAEFDAFPEWLFERPRVLTETPAGQTQKGIQ